MKIIKRNGSEETFNIEKIINAIRKANNSADSPFLTEEQITDIADYVEYKCNKIKRAVSVEEIQDMVEDQLMAKGAFELARRYVRYRYNRSLVRKANTTDNRILSLIECNNEEVKQENSNKNPTVNSVQRDYMAGEVSRDLTRRMLLSPDIVEADKQGLIHFHDSDYFAQHMHNCDLVNLEDMLQNGTVISDTLIEKPHSFSTACNIATQIIAQVASNQYGGQSISLTHLAPFVQISREKIRKETLAEIEEMGVEISEEKIHQIVEERLRKEVNRGVQTIQYQVVTLLTTNGQAPFVTVYMYLNEAENEQQKADLALIIEETLKQRYQGVKNEAGVWITPAFPKLIYVLEEDNVTEGSKYWYLTELAAKCTAKRMVPDYISEKVMLELKGDVYTCMGCRSFLTPDRFTDAGVGNIANAGNYVEGKHKYYGRFNQGVVTVNLVDIGLSANRDMDKFWKIFDERMDLCHRALKARHERLKGTLSDAAPILWQYGALARLKKGETIDKLLYGGYSTISLGYAGLWECVYSLIGKKLTEEEGKELGLEIMKALRHAAREHDLQVRQVPPEALRHHQGRDRPQLYHQQLPCPRNRGHQRVRQAQARIRVPGAFTRRRNQLRRGSQHAGQHSRRAPGNEVHLREYHVRRAQHKERLLPGLRLRRRDCDRGRGRKAALGVPELPQPRPGQDERRAPYLRLHRHTVLEPGQNPGDPGESAPPVMP